MAAIVVGDEGVGNGDDDYITVMSAQSGKTVSGGLAAKSQGGGTLVSTSLTGVTAGWYTVHYNIASADGHMVGGDSGSWFAFGYKGVTAIVKKPVMLSLVPSGGGATLKATLNGARVGLRSLTISGFTGTISSVKVKITSMSSQTPVFDWTSSVNKKTKSAVVSGILPWASVTYKVQIARVIGSATVVYEASFDAS
jgi:hypothetical protein